MNNNFNDKISSNLSNIANFTKYAVQSFENGIINEALNLGLIIEDFLF